MYGIGQICFSPLVVRALRSYPRRSIIIVSQYIIAVTSAFFSMLHFIHDYHWFVYCCAGLRFLQGVAACMTLICCYSMINADFPDDKGYYMGLADTAVGLGISLGPLISSVLYLKLGFSGTFEFFSVLLLLSGIFIQCYYPHDPPENNNEEYEEGENS